MKTQGPARGNHMGKSTFRKSGKQRWSWRMRSICLPHLLQAIPCSFWTSTCVAALSLLTALYVVSSRKTRDLPTPSFRFCLTTDILDVRLYPSCYRAGSGLSPVRFCPCRAHSKETSSNCHGRNRRFLACIYTVIACRLALLIYKLGNTVLSFQINHRCVPS